MKKVVFTIFCLLTIVPFAGYAAGEVTFKAEAPQAVVKGQDFQIQYVVNEKSKDIRPPEFTGFKLKYGPAFTSFFSNENGVTSYSEIYTFTLKAESEGTFNVAPATIRVKDKQYTSNALAIKVLPPDQNAQSAGTTGEEQVSTQQVSKDQVMLVLQLSKRKVYEQEAILATLKLYFKGNITQLTDIGNPSFEGFVVQDIELAQRQPVMENYNGSNYQALPVRQWLLFPQRSGTINVGSGTIQFIMQVPRPRRQVRSIFDDMFESYDEVRREVQSGKSTIQVEALPSGKPASFMNAVGDFKISSNISSKQVKANEAITLKLQIKGTGNLKYVKNPEIKFPEDFETYEPKIDLQINSTSGGMQGTKTIEYTVIPRFGGNFTIPGVEFSYFDLATKSYKTLTTESYELTVEKGADNGSQTAGVVNNFANKESVKLLGQDIRYIRLNDMRLSKSPQFIYGSFGYWLAYLLPLLLFGTVLFIYRKQAKESANVILMKTKKANKVASKRLKLAGTYLKEHNKEAFYDEVMKATWGYLSDKLSIPVSELTKDNVEAELERYGVTPEAIREFMTILSTCEFARYAPVQSDTAMDELYVATVKAIGEMENMVKK